MTYASQILNIDSLEVVRLTDADHRLEVSICPSVGNIAYEMTANGKQILMKPAVKLDEWKAKPTQAGIPFLAPWANRLDDHFYWANGRKYVLNSEVVNYRRDANGRPIHGLLLFAPWTVVNHSATEQQAQVTSRLEFWRNPQWMAQFPFAHTIEMTYRLSGGSLEVRTSVENHSTEPLPLSIGFHPWYQIPGVPRDGWTIHMPVRNQYLLTDKFTPTGQTQPVSLPDPTPLLGRQLDDVFGGVQSDDEFWVDANGQRISIRFGPKFPIAVVYAPQTRDVVCFEPMSGVTNAFNLTHAGVYRDLQSVPPGSTWTESFSVRPSGF